jgi:predicted permease
METLFCDVRYSLRLLRRSPGFALGAVLLLGLGIGANTVVFTLTDSVLLRPLPVPKPRELTLLRWYSKPDAIPDSLSGYLDAGGNGREANSTSFSYEAFTTLRDAGGNFLDLAGFAELESVNLRMDGSTQIARAQLVSGNFFPMLGVRAARGRVIAPDDDRKENPAAVAVASARFWEQARAGKAPELGSTVSLNGRPFSIVGVAPAEFTGTLQVGSEPDLFLPLAAQPLLSQEGSLLDKPGAWWVQILGRLRKGTGIQSAQARLDAAFRGIARLGLSSLSEKNPPRLALEDGSRGQPEMAQEYVQPLLILTGMAALILVIGCANLASLLLSRAPSRRREMAVRAALGAGRGRLARQLLTESLLLGILGGGLAYCFSSWATDLAANLLPSPSPPGSLRVAPDLRTFLFMLSVSILTGTLAGLVPAWRAGRVHLTPDLRGSAQTGTARLGLGGALVGVQVAVSLVLLFGAALFVGTLRNLQRVDPGFPTGHALVFRINPSSAGYQGQRLLALYDRIASDLEALPGVRSVTFSRNGLLRGSASITRTAPFGKLKEPHAAVFSWMHVARSNFLAATGIPLIRGRGWDRTEEASARPVAVISESLAHALFGEQEAVGQRLGLEGSAGEMPLEIIGVARNAHYDRLRGAPPRSLYTPFTRDLGAAGGMTFAVRAPGDPRALLQAVRRRIAQVDPDLPVFEARTLEEQAALSVLRERQFALLATGFGAAALLLACIGLYGVLSHAVNRRSREIGIRLALGAAPGTVLRMVLLQAALPTLAGCAAGLAGALGAARLLGDMLFGIEPSNPAALGIVTALLLLTALLAACLPARRAAHTDPMQVLRYE